jgi:predicted metal-dependent phosphoesterase TrpH
MLKADLHLHSGEDFYDFIPYSAHELIDRCASHRFQVIAITNHRIMTCSDAWKDYAAERGILLIPGVEAKIKGRHVVILNSNDDANKLRTFEDLKDYRQANDVYVIAPHPFYSSSICLRDKLYEHADLFDAVEIHHYFTTFYNPNEKARKFAEAYGKPLIGNSDCHRLTQLGKTYSQIDAEFNLSSVLDALRRGRVDVVSGPIGTWDAISLMSILRFVQIKRAFRSMARKLGLKPDPLSSLHEPPFQATPHRAQINR